MTVCHPELQFDFLSDRPVVVKVSDLELSSDAGILLARQAEEQVQVCRTIASCIEDWREPNKITHSLEQLVSQRVYQRVGGYEDAIDSNQLRHDPIYKIACGRVPIPEQELLASQPSITRLENHVSQSEVSAMRSQMVTGFIKRYREVPSEVVLDIDGWDDPTHGQQQLSCFHGYYGHHMYKPLIFCCCRCAKPLREPNWQPPKSSASDALSSKGRQR
jgi:co-chaperonin GroES (HSP10)